MWQLLIVFACLSPGIHQVRAVFLEECKGVIINKVSNPNLDCSEFVHCDGDDSYYCNGDCREPVECYIEDITAEVPKEVTTLKPLPPSTSTEKSTTPDEQPKPENKTTQSTTSSTSTSTTKTTPTPSNDIHVICRTSGKNGVYPYPANSNYYYQCLSGYLLLQQCPQNFHFDVTQGQCISTKPYRSSGLHL
ncbi:hypothetical protein KR038_008174 [Drosophila bunnanda]|nr:hypothetical protein KR038_008174 [Drosophila bunnanda]